MIKEVFSSSRQISYIERVTVTKTDHVAYDMRLLLIKVFFILVIVNSRAVVGNNTELLCPLDLVSPMVKWYNVSLHSTMIGVGFFLTDIIQVACPYYWLWISWTPTCNLDTQHPALYVCCCSTAFTWSMHNRQSNSIFISLKYWKIYELTCTFKGLQNERSF